MYKVKSPVLLLVFNRPAITKTLLDIVKVVQPQRIYVGADGPRINNSDDVDKCKEVRRIVSSVDWECDVKYIYQQYNKGCKYAVSYAINNFFDSEPEGIILEDDCIPDLSFFRFCDEMLEKYRGDTRIMQICGTNILSKNCHYLNSYHFSKYGPVWGWASWKRSWKHYDVDMIMWNNVKKNKDIFNITYSRKEALYRQKLYDNLINGTIDTWDYQWGFAKLINNGLNVIPRYNLIKNVGFNKDATHTKIYNKLYSDNSLQNLEYPLVHPQYMCANVGLDKLYMKYAMGGGLISRLKNKLANMLK